MPTDMVSGGVYLLPPPALSAQAPVMATSELQPVLVFPIARWRPHSGIDSQYPLWRAGVRRILAAYALTVDELIAGVQSCSELLFATIRNNPLSCPLHG